MRKWLVLVCIFAFAAPVAAADVDPDAGPTRDVIGPEVLYPGDVYNGYNELDGMLWSYYDVWMFICVGTDTFQVDVTDCCLMGDTMLNLLIDYFSGMVGYDMATSPASATVTDTVSDAGAYFVVAGYTYHPGGFPAGYYVDAYFGMGSAECTPPPYNPEKWNDGGYVQYNNNCYNYANDERTDTFAQPGRASGCSHSITCSTTRAAAECDGLVTISSGSSPCPDDMHRVYLVTRPGWDYHWYRQDTDGMWSHKPGGTPATNRDGSGQLISNPEYADIGMYTDRCGYMCACGDNADIY